MIEYIYFEKHGISTSNGVRPFELPFELKNVNALLLKPKTNSSGYWLFRNITKRVNGEYLTVDQYWIDINKLNEMPSLHPSIMKYYLDAMSIINTELRDIKLKSIGI